MTVTQFANKLRQLFTRMDRDVMLISPLILYTAYRKYGDNIDMFETVEDMLNSLTISDIVETVNTVPFNEIHREIMNMLSEIDRNVPCTLPFVLVYATFGTQYGHNPVIIAVRTIPEMVMSFTNNYNEAVWALKKAVEDKFMTNVTHIFYIVPSRETIEKFRSVVEKVMDMVGRYVDTGTRGII